MFSFQAHRSAADNRVFILDKCQLTGQVIDIQKAVIMFIMKCSPTGKPAQCRTSRICSKTTRHDEIINCNGKGNCSFTQEVFNFPQQFSCRGSTKGNFIDIRYYCINGEQNVSRVLLSYFHFRILTLVFPAFGLLLKRWFGIKAVKRFPFCNRICFVLVEYSKVCARLYSIL